MTCRWRGTLLTASWICFGNLSVGADVDVVAVDDWLRGRPTTTRVSVLSPTTGGPEVEDVCTGSGRSTAEAAGDARVK